MNTTNLPVRVGDIRWLSAPFGHIEPAQLGLIIAMEPSQEFVEVLLVHDDIEFQSDSDYVVELQSDDKTSSYVVQTRARGVIWTLQCGPLLARLEPSSEQSRTDIEFVPRSQRGAATGLEPSHQGTLEIQRFKQEQLQALRRISEDCTSALLDDTEVWRLDPRILEPEFVADKNNPQVYIGQLMKTMYTHSIIATPEDIQRLYAAGVFESDNWHGVLSEPSLELALVRAANELVDSALSMPDRSDDSATLRNSIEYISLVETEGGHYVSSDVGLVSDASFWADAIAPGTDAEKIAQLWAAPIFLQARTDRV